LLTEPGGDYTNAAKQALRDVFSFARRSNLSSQRFRGSLRAIVRGSAFPMKIHKLCEDVRCN